MAKSRYSSQEWDEFYDECKSNGLKVKDLSKRIKISQPAISLQFRRIKALRESDRYYHGYKCDICDTEFFFKEDVVRLYYIRCPLKCFGMAHKIGDEE